MPGAQTLALAVTNALPEVIYWGARLPDGENLDAIAAAAQSDLTGGMIDALPALSLTPEAGRAFQGQPGLGAVRRQTAPPCCPPSSSTAPKPPPTTCA